MFVKTGVGRVSAIGLLCWVVAGLSSVWHGANNASGEAEYHSSEAMCK